MLLPTVNNILNIAYHLTKNKVLLNWVSRDYLNHKSDAYPLALFGYSSVSFDVDGNKHTIKIESINKCHNVAVFTKYYTGLTTLLFNVLVDDKSVCDVDKLNRVLIKRYWFKLSNNTAVLDLLTPDEREKLSKINKTFIFHSSKNKIELEDIIEIIKSNI